MKPYIVDFDSLPWEAPIRYTEGSGIFIPQGAAHAHKARSVTQSVLLYLVEGI